MVFSTQITLVHLTLTTFCLLVFIYQLQLDTEVNKNKSQRTLLLHYLDLMVNCLYHQSKFCNCAGIPPNFLFFTRAENIL